MSEKIIEFTEVHSPEQLASLGQIVKFLCNEPQVERRHAYAVLSQLSKHAHPAFEILADRLSSVERNSKGLAFIERERKINAAATNALTLVGVDFVKRFANDLLSTHKPVLIQNDLSKPLIVVFTTRYNNFFISNLVFGALLQQTGNSILFLKDTTGGNYLKGMKNFGDNWESSLIALNKRITKFEGLIFTGFSSGGYASLLASLSLDAQKFIGFSITTDLSPKSKRPKPPFLNEELETLPIELRRDLSRELHRKKTDFVFFAGEKSPYDLEHAMACENIDNAEINIVPGEEHFSMRPMFIDGKLAEVFIL